MPLVFRGPEKKFNSKIVSRLSLKFVFYVFRFLLFSIIDEFLAIFKASFYFPVYLRQESQVFTCNESFHLFGVWLFERVPSCTF